VVTRGVVVVVVVDDVVVGAAVVGAMVVAVGVVAATADVGDVDEGATLVAVVPGRSGTLSGALTVVVGPVVVEAATVVGVPISTRVVDVVVPGALVLVVVLSGFSGCWLPPGSVVTAAAVSTTTPLSPPEPTALANHSTETLAIAVASTVPAMTKRRRCGRVIDIAFGRGGFRHRRTLHWRPPAPTPLLTHSLRAVRPIRTPLMGSIVLFLFRGGRATPCGADAVRSTWETR
jgi:hypothetical protein